MTITESKKFSNDDGSAHYKKHKIYLYKEDFEEFAASFKEVSDFIFEKKGKEVISNTPAPSSDDNSVSDNTSDTTDEINESSEDFSDVKFEDI